MATFKEIMDRLERQRDINYQPTADDLYVDALNIRTEVWIDSEPTEPSNAEICAFAEGFRAAWLWLDPDYFDEEQWFTADDC